MPERMMESVHIAVSICVAAPKVYEFASNPANLPQWATAFCQSIRQEGEDWVIQTSEGDMVISFVKNNPFGVLDHIVRLPTGVEVYNPMRVIPNGNGSDVMFTLFQTPHMTPDKYANDAKLVQTDLEALKRVLEEQHKDEFYA